MKKNIIFSLLIVFFLIMVLSFIKTFTFNRYITVQDISGYTKKMNELTKKIENIKDDKCKTSLNNMAIRINQTHFNKNVLIKKYVDVYFKDEITFLDYYNEVVDSCKNKYDEDIYSNVLASLSYPYQIRKEYLLRYEISLFDIKNRNKLNKYDDELGTYSTKYLELSVLSKLIDGVNV